MSTRSQARVVCLQLPHREEGGVWWQDCRGVVDGAEPAGLAAGGGVRRPVRHLREVRGTCTGHPSIVLPHGSLTSVFVFIYLNCYIFKHVFVIYIAILYRSVRALSSVCVLPVTAAASSRRLSSRPRRRAALQECLPAQESRHQPSVDRRRHGVRRQRHGVSHTGTRHDVN